MRIAVVGAGTAGALSATLLARSGHSVEVFERVREPKPVGAGIVLQPTGQAVLESAGILGPLQKAAPIVRLQAKTRNGVSVVDLNYQSVRLVDQQGNPQHRHGMGVHRGVLFQSLFDAAHATPGVEIHLGAAVHSTELRTDGRYVAVENQTHGPFDLVLACDGMGSLLRAQRGSEYEYGAMWFVASDPKHIFADSLDQVVDGTQQMIGFLPTGKSPDDDNVVSLYFSAKRGDAENFRGARFQEFQELVASADPRAGLIVDQLKSGDQLLFADYQHVHRAQVEPRLVFLGDAAHAMSPQLGQGANLALMDAWHLCERLGQFGASRKANSGESRSEFHKNHVDSNTLESTLRDFRRARAAHLRYYRYATRWLTPFFQSDATWLGSVRDRVFPWMNRVGYFRRQMEESMAGVKMGLFSKPIALPSPPKLLPRTS